MFSFKEKIKRELAKIDIEINGTRPWDIQVRNERLYRQVILRGSIGLGEAYMDGWWDCQKLDDFFYRVLRSQLHMKFRAPGQDFFHRVANLINRQTISRSHQVIEQHYDLGNDLYTAMLDKHMVYTCGYWSGTPPASGLEEAQEAKLDLICRKIGLKAGQRVLDIGCGFGSFAKYATEKYGAQVTGITISHEQLTLAKKMTAGLPVEILLQDYRNIQGVYDHVVSIGMFEAVGHKNYQQFMEIVAKHLKDDGVFLLHTIGESFSGLDVDPWIDKYIFPNGILPRIKNIGESIDGLFVAEDWHNFGADYDQTLLAWHQNFEEHWDILQNQYSDRFRRMWHYYLLSCAGSFRARNIQLWQIVLAKNGRLGGYTAIR